MATDCIFCRIVAGESPCHRVWESGDHLAFLSIFPNTDGFTVVIPKRHHTSYAFALEDAVLTALVLATRDVARLIDERLPDVGRTAMIFEGFGVDHVHSKLFPLHGAPKPGQPWAPIISTQDKYFTRYEGYVSSHDGPRADDARLAALARRIRGGADA